MAELERNVTLDPVSDLASLIAPIGSRAFEDHFDRTCRAMFGNDQCNIFYFPDGGNRAPRSMLSSAASEPVSKLTSDLSLEYIDGGFRSDPFLAKAWRRGISASAANIGLLRDADVVDSGYRRQFYKDALVRQKIATVVETGGVAIYLNFYRNPAQPDFTADDCQRLRSCGTMLGALAMKHLSMTGQIANTDKGSPPPVGRPDRDRLAARLCAAFLNDPAGLTPREAEICAAVCIGMNSEAIGLFFGISGNTVATHRKRAYAKLGVCSQSELFARYLDWIGDAMRRSDA